MKKFISILCLVLCFLLVQTSVFAAESPVEGKKATEITVSFKIGTGSYSVNGKSVKAEPSVQTGGKTFVPVKVITDALGASLTVDLKAKTAVINYNNVDIKIFDKKKEALISNKKVTIDAAPYIKNNNFMASISFLADTLGADVKNTSGTFTFVKQIANPNSIKDFSSLIKKTTKNRIGDSYYNWSMQLPDELKLQYRDFNGSENIFAAQDESYFVLVYLFDADKNTTLNNAIGNLREKMKEYTQIDFIEGTNNGVDYVEFVFKDDEWTIRERVIIANNKEYDFLIFTKNEDTYDDEKYQNLASSFDFTFKNDGTAEDLSDITKEGYRKYQDTRLKWNMDIIPYWEEYKDEKIQNKIVFTGKDDEYLSVAVYSLDKGDTLDSITKKAVDNYSAEYSSDFYSIKNQEKINIGGAEGNKVSYTLKYPKKIVYGYEIFFVDNNYKYIVCAEMSEDTYNNNKKQRKMIEGMLDSFKYKNIDTKTVGKLLDPTKITLADRYRTIEDDAYTIDIPAEWADGELNDDTYKTFSGKYISVGIGIVDQVSYLPGFISYLDSQYAKDSSLKVQSKTTLTFNGGVGYKYIIQLTDKEGYTYRMEQYVVEKGGKAFYITFIVDNNHYSTKNMNIIDKVWQSFLPK